MTPMPLSENFCEDIGYVFPLYQWLKKVYCIVLYCIVLYLQPVLNPKSYDGARVLEASGRPIEKGVDDGDISKIS